MRRIKVTDNNGELAGWFDLDRVTEYKEDRDWDGNNFVSVNTNSPFHHQTLYRTAGGRWVLLESSNYQGSLDHWSFVTDTQAREWLIKNAEDDAAEEHFGAVEDERGPDLGGRPAVGPTISTRLPAELLEWVDADAEARGETRAEAIRRLLAAALSSSSPL